MEQRMDLGKLAQSIYKSMAAAEKSLAVFELDQKILYLIQLRVSQINGCGYCVNMHSYEAKKAGESEQRIYTVSTWWEVPFFNEAERALFKLAEEVTRISEGGVTDKTFDAAIKHHGMEKVAGWIYAITLINTWNRLAISVHMVAEAVE